tara:strand:- start:164 stop:1720 length:1557 start_codon:yes stop_codon:yes gene_type:complete
MNIRKILVVGGGTSGWMAAASIFKALPNVEVSLVESKSIPTIGVGESTLGQFNIFLDMLGLKDEDWMAECNATYKNGIRFNNFNDLGSSYDYPFGGRDRIDIKNKWAAVRDCYNLPINESYNEWHNDNSLLMKYNRCTKNTDGLLDAFDFRYDTSYHFDSKLLAEYLKKFCTGVEHHYDNIVSVNKDENGYLTSVVGEVHGDYTADLFIDCTGFQSRLLEKEMGSEFLSYKPWLDNDRALATHVPYKDKSKELVNFTRCTGIDSGWVWTVPLWNSLGTGYCYSSDFVDDDTAEIQFKKHLGTDDVDIKKINIRHGIHKEGWVKNVVAIGLSYAFVEPLESSSLASTHECLLRLVRTLKDRDCCVNRFDADLYNITSANDIDSWRDFVAIHYAASSRDDTRYWRHQTQEKSYINLGSGKFIKHNVINDGITFDDKYQGLSQNLYGYSGGWTYVMAGNGYKIPAHKRQQEYNAYQSYGLPYSSDEVEHLYLQWRTRIKKLTSEIQKLPSHDIFLSQHIYT